MDSDSDLSSKFRFTRIYNLRLALLRCLRSQEEVRDGAWRQELDAAFGWLQGEKNDRSVFHSAIEQAYAQQVAAGLIWSGWADLERKNALAEMEERIACAMKKRKAGRSVSSVSAPATSSVS